MKVVCQNCGVENASGSSFCKNCGRLLAATNVQGRTVVIPASPAQGPLTGFDPKTVVQRAQQAYGTQAMTTATSLMTKGSPNQREHTIITTDYSASMDEPYTANMTKLDAAKRAAIVMICNKFLIDPQDEIGLVAFNSRAEVLMDLYPLISHKRDMIQVIQALQADNGTDINEGLVTAVNMFDWGRKNVVRRIGLLTDGKGGEPLQTAEDFKSRGGIIDVVGIGDRPANVEEKLLKKVASVVAGELRYRFIKDHQSLIAHYTQLANKTAIK